MQTSFAKTLHSVMSSFHLHISEMIFTLDDISCLVHLPIRGKLLYHKRTDREEASEKRVTYFGDDLSDAENEVADIRGAHARYKFYEKLYKDHVLWLWMSTGMICRLSTTDNVH